MQVAVYLRQRVTPSDTLFVANYEAILYYLVPARRPTRYSFPKVLTSTHFARVAGIDALTELRRIMGVVQPAFVAQGRAQPIGSSSERFPDTCPPTMCSMR